MADANFTVTCRKTARHNPFLVSKAGVNGAASGDEDDGDDSDLAEIIVSDDGIY